MTKGVGSNPNPDFFYISETFWGSGTQIQREIRHAQRHFNICKIHRHIWILKVKVRESLLLELVTTNEVLETPYMASKLSYADLLLELFKLWPSHHHHHPKAQLDIDIRSFTSFGPAWGLALMYRVYKQKGTKRCTKVQKGTHIYKNVQLKK